MKILDNVVFGDAAYNIPAHLSFGQQVLDILRDQCTLGEVALINGDNGHKVTYQQILEGTVNTAVGLTKLGVKRGDVVALCCENRPEFLTAALGVICCGATVTTLNLMYSKDEFTHALKISRPSMIFCSEIAITRHVNLIKTLPFVKKIIQLNGDRVAADILLYRDVLVPTDPHSYIPADVQGWTDSVYILYSSGTTGLPKGVMITHVNLLNSAAGFLAEVESERRRILTIVPWYHAYGLISTINNVLAQKLIVYFSAGFNPDKYLHAIQEYKIMSLNTVPPIVVFLAKSPLVEKYDMSSVKWVWCGAAPLSAETIEALLKRLPNCRGVYQGYGMTETSLVATKDQEETKPKPGSGGYPMAGSKVKVVDLETRVKLGPYQKGEICIKGPNLMKGYIGDEAATRNVFDDEDYLKSGDVGYYDEDGCFYVVDRLKELIKYKGNQVAPAAVESVILQHSSVAECGVVGAPDEIAGELPTAFVVVKPGAKLTERELLDFAKSKLSPSSHLHGGVIFVNDIPKNPSGKILRRLLKEQLKQKLQSKL